MLVRNLFMPVDPYMRGRMNEGPSYVPPFEIGKPLEGGAVGDVIESRAPEFKPGDVVTSNFGWQGIDVYFDNVGGKTLQAALSALHLHGRIVACGGISGYNAEQPRPGPSNLFNITTRRLTMKGFIVSDWMDRRAEFERELDGYFKAGNLNNLETREKGIDQAVGAFLGLFQGRNVGKMVPSTRPRSSACSAQTAPARRLPSRCSPPYCRNRWAKHMSPDLPSPPRQWTFAAPSVTCRWRSPWTANLY